MSNTISITKNFQAGGKSFGESRSVTVNDARVIEPAAIAAAKTGSLTTRTDNDTGELTMTAGHGITTGARLDIYWVGGHRRGMTVGTVATNAVPIDGGAGDNLPSTSTAITAMIPTELVHIVDGDLVDAILTYSDAKGTIVFTDDSDVELHAVHFPQAAMSDAWYTDNGVTNPLAGDTLGKVYFSHADSSASKTMRAALGVN